MNVEPAMWVTPSSRDWKDGPGMAIEGPDGRSRLDQLPRQMGAVSAWATPTVANAQGNGYQRDGRTGREYLTLPGQMDPSRAPGATEPIGPEPSGSSATTARRGAPNPLFACWLMGFPDEWISGALRAMESLRGRRRKSSPRSST